MKINKKIIMIITIVMSLSMLAGCGNGKGDKNSVEGIKAKGKLVMGTSADYPPYEFSVLEDGKEKIVGFDVALAKHIADELGVELEIKDMDFKNLIAALPSGKVDIVIAGMNPDPKRAEEVNFSDIYYNASHGVLIRKDMIDEIVSEDDLIGKKLGAQMGSMQEEIAEGIKDADVKSLALTNNLLMELKANKIDAVIMEKPVAESYAKGNDDLMLVEGITIESGEGGSAIAMKKGNDELTKKINEILKDVEDKNLLDAWIVEAQEYQELLGSED